MKAPRRPVRPLIKTPKRQPLPVPVRHEPLKIDRMASLGNGREHGRWYIEALMELRNRDQGAMVAYTDWSNLYNTDQLMQHVLEVGHALGEAGVGLPLFERLDAQIRWEFGDPAAALMFKLKLGTQIVPPPWKSVLP